MGICSIRFKQFKQQETFRRRRYKAKPAKRCSKIQFTENHVHPWSSALRWNRCDLLAFVEQTFPEGHFGFAQFTLGLVLSLQSLEQTNRPLIMHTCTAKREREREWGGGGKTQKGECRVKKKIRRVRKRATKKGKRRQRQTDVYTLVTCVCNYSLAHTQTHPKRHTQGCTVPVQTALLLCSHPHPFPVPHHPPPHPPPPHPLPNFHIHPGTLPIHAAGWLVGWLTSQQHASVSQGRICTDNFTCCYTEIEVADPTLYLTQSQYTDTRPTSPSTDPTVHGAWQGSYWSANF